ncbi:hypothetical protein [Streptomyces sp. NPDC046371]|uniref:hypothetical protein n=1 Tax=Streptomyces sp. NPDC046371 TaxID=3154916 RepID=UPI0034018C64
MSLVTRDPATGLRRNPIVYPDGQPSTPYGCRWCGISERAHFQRWKASARWHTWAAPTDTQILARMRARRAARLNTPPSQHHAATTWSGDWNGDTDPYCADCDTRCAQWLRVQQRLEEQRWARDEVMASTWPDEEPF